MPENDSTHGPRSRKPKRPTIPPKSKTPAKPPREPYQPQPPLIEAGQVYGLLDFMRRVGISKTTCSRWRAAGFKILRPGTKRAIVIADDAIEFIRTHPNLEAAE